MITQTIKYFIKQFQANIIETNSVNLENLLHYTTLTCLIEKKNPKIFHLLPKMLELDHAVKMIVDHVKDL